MIEKGDKPEAKEVLNFRIACCDGNVLDVDGGGHFGFGSLVVMGELYRGSRGLLGIWKSFGFNSKPGRKKGGEIYNAFGATRS